MSRKPRAGDSASPLVTREILHLTLQEFRSDLHRALWIHGTAVVVAGGAIAAAAAAASVAIVD